MMITDESLKFKVDEIKKIVNLEIELIAQMVEDGKFPQIWIASENGDWLNTYETFKSLAVAIRARKHSD